MSSKSTTLAIGLTPMYELGSAAPLMLSTFATFSHPSAGDHRWSEMIAATLQHSAGSSQSLVEIIEWSFYLFDPRPQQWHEPITGVRWFERQPGYQPPVLLVDNPSPQFHDISHIARPADRYAYIGRDDGIRS